MPNHVENDLYIQGDESDIAQVLAHIGASQDPPRFDFRTIIPYPERFAAMDQDHAEVPEYPLPADPEREIKLAERERCIDAYVAKWGTASDGYNSGGYDWCCDNWGTKWNAYEVERRDYGGRVTLTFQTAWAPPLPVIQALAERFIRCSFSLEYFEHGAAFCGGATWPNDEDYWSEDNTPWRPGIKTDEWKGEYRGYRGG